MNDPVLSHLFFQINIEDLEEGPVVNGERSDCLLTDAVVSRNKRRSPSGSTETKRDGEAADRAALPEQVWGCVVTRRGQATHTLSCHFLGSILPVAQFLPNFLGGPHQICMKSSRLTVAMEGATFGVPQTSFPGSRGGSQVLRESALAQRGVCSL